MLKKGAKKTPWDGFALKFFLCHYDDRVKKRNSDLVI